MNFRKRLKRIRARWAKMARDSCKFFGLPFKTYLTWDELPDSYKELNQHYDVPYVVSHYGPGVTIVAPYLRESDFTLVEDTDD